MAARGQGRKVPRRRRAGPRQAPCTGCSGRGVHGKNIIPLLHASAARPSTRSWWQLVAGGGCGGAGGLFWSLARRARSCRTRSTTTSLPRQLCRAILATLPQRTNIIGRVQLAAAAKGYKLVWPGLSDETVTGRGRAGKAVCSESITSTWKVATKRYAQRQPMERPRSSNRCKIN